MRERRKGGLGPCLLALIVLACVRPQAALVQAEEPHLTREVAATWMSARAPEDLAWDWRDGVLIYGFRRLFERTGEARYGDYVRRYLDHHLARGVRVRWSDDATPALTAAAAALAGERRYLPLVAAVATYTMRAPRTPRQQLVRHLGERVPSWFFPRFFPDVWIDSIFHLVPTLLRAEPLLGEPRYGAEAWRLLLGFARNLQDPESGLFTHAYNDARDEQVPAFDERLFWARGNGWMLVTLVDALEQPGGDPATRAELAARLERLRAALLPLQTERGLFRTLLTDPSTYEETAATGLIAYGLARGVRAGFFDEATRDAARRAMHGLFGCLRRVSGGVEVHGTSLGTNPVAFRYRRVGQAAQVSYGVGAYLLAASELDPELVAFE